MINRMYSRYPMSVAGLLSLLLAAGCNLSPEAKEAKFLQRGKALMEKKDFSRALLEFRNASRAVPKDAEPFYQMGLDYLASGNANAAFSAFRKAAALNPKHVDAQLKVAEMLAASPDPKQKADALTRLENLAKTAPDNPEANDALALAEYQQGQQADGIKLLEDTLRSRPSHLPTAVGLAKLKMAQNDPAGAEAVLKRVVAASPKSVDAEIALGQFYLSTKQPEKAEPEIRRALQIDPKSGPALMSLASIQVATKRMDDAEKTYRQVSTLPGADYKPMHAMFEFSRGNREQGLSELQKLADQDHSDRGARTRLLSAYLQMGKRAEAHKLLDDEIKQSPKDAEALLQRAEISTQEGKLSQAEADTREVLRQQPSLAPAHFALANILKFQNLPKSERQELKEAIRLDPNLLMARVALARNYRESGEGKMAIEYLDQAPANEKSTVGFLVERNWALLAAGQTKELKDTLDRVLPAARVPELVLQDAIYKMSAKDYPGARAEAEEVLQKAPAEVRAAEIIVDTYAAQKQPEKGVERLKQLVAAQPRSAALQFLLAQWEVRAKNTAEARRALEAAKAADPNFVRADLALSDLDRMDNHPDAAKQRLDAIVKAHPKNTAALLQLAAVLEQLGDHKGSVAAYQSVLDVDDSNVTALNNLAYALAPNNPDDALRYAQKAAEAAPENPTVQDTIGWIYYKKGIYGTALGYLKSAVAKEPTPKREYHLGLCYLKSGDNAMGEKTMQAALVKDPTLSRSEQ